MTWVGYTNTFLVAAANLLTAIATLVYILRTHKTVTAAKDDVEVIKQTIESLPNDHSGPTERPLG